VDEDDQLSETDSVFMCACLCVHVCVCVCECVMLLFNMQLQFHTLPRVIMK